MLTNIKINALSPKSKSYKVSDGQGLFLIIKPNGGKSWQFRYRFGGEKSLSLGKFPEVSIKDARIRRQEAIDQLRVNIDPSSHRRQQKLEAIRSHENSFGAIAREWYSANSHRWTPRHSKKLWRVLEIHLLPYLKREPITDIKPRDLLAVLRKIEAKGATETSHRAFWIARRIFNYAIAIDACEVNPAQNIGDGLKAHVTTGHPCIDVGELPTFLAKFERLEMREQDRLAMRLLALTVLRTGELRRCRWTDVHLQNAELRVPKEVMKMREDHVVPLSRQATEALIELYSITGHQEWLFPNHYQSKHPVMSENVINNLIAEMGYKGRMVGHSFRKLFSTILNEREFNPDAIERQLAHAERRKSRAAYNRALYLNARRDLMQWWADYLDSLVGVQAWDSLPPTKASLRAKPAVYDSHNEAI